MHRPIRLVALEVGSRGANALGATAANRLERRLGLLPEAAVSKQPIEGTSHEVSESLHKQTEN